MAATPTSLPGLPGTTRPRRARGGYRAIVVVLSLSVCFVVIDAFAGERGLAALVRMKRENATLAADVEARQREIAQMQEQVRRLSGGDPTAIEEVARRELGFIRPGERLFIIRDVTPAGRKK